MHKAFIQVQDILDHIDNGTFTFLLSVAGDYREADVYCDAIVPRKYIEGKWLEHFDVIKDIDDLSRFWCAVETVLRK